jgi:hypothetical protein
VTLVSFPHILQSHDSSNRTAKSPPPRSRAEVRPPSPSSSSPNSRALSFRSIQALDQHDDKASIALNDDSVTQQVLQLRCDGGFCNPHASACASVGVRVCGRQRSFMAPYPPFLWIFTFFCACCYCRIAVLNSHLFAPSAPRTAVQQPVCTTPTRL